MNENKPLVAIHCLVYNHEPYLRDCFEGFVMQQTNFPFVAIVHDDASTDGSAAIIHEYEVKYPHIFKPIYQKENLYRRSGLGVINDVMFSAIDTIGAKYIAMCEGDDYWTDPLKLQKQVDFMETNEGCSLCFHKVKTLIQKTGEFKDEFIVRDMPDKSNIIDLAKGNYIHTPSVLYKKECLDAQLINKMMPCLPGDYVIWMLLAENGYIYKFDEPMAVYRYGVGIWSDKVSKANSLEALKTLTKLSCMIKNSEAREVLVREVKMQTIWMLESFESVEQQYYQITSSHAYRLGKFILSPFSWLRRMLTSKK